MFSLVNSVRQLRNMAYIRVSLTIMSSKKLQFLYHSSGGVCG